MGRKVLIVALSGMLWLSAFLVPNLGHAQSVVDYYSASTTQIDRVQAVRLWWRVRDASRVDIYDGFRNVVIPSLGNENYIEVWPERTSTYTLLVYGATGSLEKTVPITITVNITPAPSPNPPDVELPTIFFTMESPLPTPGNSVMLKWSVTRASRIELFDQFGQLNLSNLPASGTFNVSPTVTTTYTMRAHDALGRSVERNVTVTIQDREPKILFFRGNTDYVLAGQPVTLEWRAEQVSYVSIIGPGIPGGRRNPLPAFSSLTVYPKESGVYLLYAFTADGRFVQAQYTVTVANL